MRWDKIEALGIRKHNAYLRNMANLTNILSSCFQIHIIVIHILDSVEIWMPQISLWKPWNFTHLLTILIFLNFWNFLGLSWFPTMEISKFMLKFSLHVSNWTCHIHYRTPSLPSRRLLALHSKQISLFSRYFMANQFLIGTPKCLSRIHG